MKEQFYFKIKCQKELKIEKLNVLGNILEDENILLFSIGKIFDIKKNLLELANLHILFLKQLSLLQILHLL